MTSDNSAEWTPSFSWQPLPEKLAFSGLEINLTRQIARIPHEGLQLSFRIPSLDNRTVRVKVNKDDKIGRVIEEVVKEWPGVRGRNFRCPLPHNCRLAMYSGSQRNYYSADLTVETASLYFKQKNSVVIVLDNDGNEILDMKPIKPPIQTSTSPLYTSPSPHESHSSPSSPSSPASASSSKQKDTLTIQPYSTREVVSSGSGGHKPSSPTVNSKRSMSHTPNSNRKVVIENPAYRKGDLASSHSHQHVVTSEISKENGSTTFANCHGQRENDDPPPICDFSMCTTS